MVDFWDIFRSGCGIFFEGFGQNMSSWQKIDIVCLL